MILFILMPFLGGYIGYKYAPDEVTEKIVFEKEESKNEILVTGLSLYEGKSFYTFVDGNKKELVPSTSDYEISLASESPEGKFLLYRETRKLGSDDPGKFSVLDRQTNEAHQIVFDNDDDLYQKYLDPNNQTEFDLRYVNVSKMEWTMYIGTDGGKVVFLESEIASVDKNLQPAFYVVQYKSVSPVKPWVLSPSN